MEYKLDPEAGSHCLQCGSTLYGRPDKKFCSDPCKNRWHNSRAIQRRRFRERIITDLSANYRILEGLLEQGLENADRDALETLGFRPARISGHRRVRGGHDEYQCFDIRYIQTDTRLIHIRRVSVPELSIRRPD